MIGAPTRSSSASRRSTLLGASRTALGRGPGRTSGELAQPSQAVQRSPTKTRPLLSTPRIAISDLPSRDPPGCPACGSPPAMGRESAELPRISSAGIRLSAIHPRIAMGRTPPRSVIPPIDPVPLEWTALRDFLAVAEGGSLSAAARRLGVSQPTLTRRMAALEERLGAELFLRTPRGLELTEAGEAILEPARHMEQEARNAEVAVTGRDRALAGPVRITATEGLAIDWLTPELAVFRRNHPEIEIQFLIRNTNVNLLELAADIAVPLARPRQADLVARRVGTLAYGLYAEHGYLDARGRPRNDDDLRGHQAVVFDELLRHSQFGTWLERSLGP